MPGRKKLPKKVKYWTSPDFPLLCFPVLFHVWVERHKQQHLIQNKVFYFFHINFPFKKRSFFNTFSDQMKICNNYPLINFKKIYTSFKTKAHAEELQSKFFLTVRSWGFPLVPTGMQLCAYRKGSTQLGNSFLRWLCLKVALFKRILSQERPLLAGGKKSYI